MKNEQETSKEYYIYQWANDKDLLNYLKKLGWHDRTEVQKLYAIIQDLSHELSVKKIDEQE